MTAMKSANICTTDDLNFPDGLYYTHIFISFFYSEHSLDATAGMASITKITGGLRKRKPVILRFISVASL